MNQMNDAATLSTRDVPAYMQGVGARARDAARLIARASTGEKNRALLAAADAIDAQVAAILAANAKDVARAREAGHDAAFVDRLAMTESSVRAMAQGVR